MQSTRSGTQVDIFVFAVPQACATVHALLAIKNWNSVFTTRDCLSGAHFDAHPRFALTTKLRPNEHYVLRVSGRRLNTAAYQQGILMRDQQLSIERNLRPPATVHEAIVQCTSLLGTLLLQSSKFGRGDSGCKKRLQRLRRSF
jgi:hypothetical protein